jgi:hypothetical protein
MLKMKHQYDTLSEAVNDLKKRGFNHDFIELKEKLYCTGNNCNFNPEEFEIVEFYRFEGISDPEDNSILYAVKSNDNKTKGIIIDAYGAYADTDVSKLISKIKIAKRSNFGL